MRRGRHAARTMGLRWLPALLASSLVLALLLGGAAFAGYRYDRATSTRMLPGVRVAGVDVGGMTRAQAIAAVRPVAGRVLDRSIEIRLGDDLHTVTPRELGSRIDVAAAVDRALSLGGSYGWTTRVYHRLTRRPVDRGYELRVRHDPKRVRAFVGSLADRVQRPAQDAGVDVVGTRLVAIPSQTGAAVRRDRASDAVLRALRSRKPAVGIKVWPVEPQVTEDELGKAIVVSVSENRLYLYEGVDLVKSYRVATGQPRYPTPRGRWTVINKRINPTWVNPALDSWGANSPAFIPPGPDNPLGTRALDLDAPGIRIHGTYDDDSIGTHASHGCIRMHIPASEELFELVGVGTPVFVVD